MEFVLRFCNVKFHAGFELMLSSKYVRAPSAVTREWLWRRPSLPLVCIVTVFFFELSFNSIIVC